MKIRVGMIAVLVVAVMGFASSAAACEKCVSSGYNGWVQCSSGHASGHQSCYGGFGTSCTLTGSCGSGGGGGGWDDCTEYCWYEQWAKDPGPIGSIGDRETPTQGFVLRADRSAQRGELTQSVQLE